MTYTQHSLKNGVRLIAAPQKGTKSVTLLVLLPVGSRYETKTINGVSHFVEHLMFKGTTRRPTSLDISRELDSVGAEFNAFTAKDYTGYYIKTASDNIELAFDVLSDMLFHSVFDEKEIQKERGVIIQEINMYEDNPQSLIGSAFENILYGNHPLGWDIIGTKEIISSISRKKITQYRDDHYTPNQMIVSVAGYYDSKQLYNLANRYFGKYVGRNKSVFQKKSLQQSKPRVSVKFKDSHQVQLALGFHAYKIDDRRQYPLVLLETIMGGTMSSRLFTTLREEHGLCYYVRTGGDAFSEVGYSGVYAGLDKERLSQAIKLILSELKKVKEFGVTEKELSEAKENYRGKMVLAMEDSERLADWYAKHALFYKKILTPEQRVEAAFRVTRKQVNVIAKEVINPKKINMALIGPYKTEKKFYKLLNF